MKKIVSFLLLLSVILCSVSAFAFEYQPYTGVKNVKASYVSILNESGVEISSFSAGEKVCASVKVRAAEELATKATLVIGAYSDGILRDISWSSCENIYTDRVTKLKTDFVTVPESGAAIRVYLCDDASRNFAKPLYSMGEMGKSGKISGVSIGGRLFEDFEEDTYEYDIELDAHFVNFPEIIAFCDDVLTSVKAKLYGAFPLTDVKRGALCTSPVYEMNGTAKAEIYVNDKVYTFNFTQKNPTITNIAPTFESGESEMGVVYDIGEPDWESAGVESLNTAKSVTVEDYSGKFNENNGVKRSSIFTRGGGYTRGIMFDIAPELRGSNIVTIYDDQSVKMSNLAFKLSRGGRIYIYSGHDLTVDGFKKTTDKVMFKYIMLTSKFKIIEGNQLYYKDVDITEDFEGNYFKVDFDEEAGNARIDISVNKTKPFVFVKFEDGKNVENVKYTIDSTESDSSFTYFNKPLVREESDDYSWYKAGEKNAGGLDDGYLPGLGTGNTLAASFPFSDKLTRDNNGYFPIEMTEELEGAIALQIPSSKVSKVSFDLKSTSYVYVLSNYDADSLSPLLEGYEALEGDGDAALIKAGTNDNISLPNASSFKKIYFVEDETKENVTVNLPGEDKCAVILVVPVK